MGTTAQSEHRQRLLEGLAVSIRERGLAQTQITDIVRHARASRTTFYKSFEDKDACFIELVRDTTTIGLRAVEAAMDSSATWDQQVNDGLRAYFEALATEPALAVAVTRDLATLGPVGVKVQQEGVERYAELLCRVSRRTVMRRAGVRPLSMPSAVLLVAGINAMVARAVDRGEDIRKLHADAQRAVVGLLARSA